jgi:hypothetical protein
MLVFAVAGYRAHSDAMRNAYLPPDIVSSAPSNSSGVVFASTRPSSSVIHAVAPTLVDASSGVLRPNQIAVEAGTQSEVVFTGGSRCTSRLDLEDLGIELALGGSGGSILLPPLRPGTYPITCAHGNVIGLLVAQ